VKTEERQRARELRERGASVKEIERALGVSRSSVSRWVRDIVLGDDQRRALAARVTEGKLRVAEEKAAAARVVRAGYQAEGRRLARERGGSYAAGCMLYWGEGSKDRCKVELSNSDPALIARFARFLREEFGVPDDSMRIHCQLFVDHLPRQREVEAFWLKTCGLSWSNLRKSTVNVQSRASLNKRTKLLPYGTCKLSVGSTRIVQTIYGSIQEYGGFERPEWLD
jgi:transcriptional regulator with XRE-family HTH domain